MKFAKIRTQMISYYILLLAVSLLISSVLYQRFNRSLVDSKIAEVSEQSLYAIQSSMNSLFDNTSKYSQRVIASSTVQELMKTDFSNEGFVYSNNSIQKVLNEIFLAEPSVASVYLFRNDDLYYSLEFQQLGINVASIKTASWYQEAVQKSGGLIWRINAGGVPNSQTKGEPYLSLIRVVNDLNTAKQIGVIMINIPLTQIKKLYEHSVDGKKYDLMVDREDARLIQFENPELRQFAESAEFRTHAEGSFIKTISGKRYIFDMMEVGGWRYATAFSMSEWPNPYKAVNRVLIPIAAFNFVFIFIGFIWITRSIIYPILSLLRSMRKAETGNYQQVILHPKSNEIRQLQDRYNRLIVTIEQSMERVKEEQTLRRKLELHILHQQIKPHFLYNALESAGYMALAGEREETYRLISALAQYYRLSLSKGNEIISLKEEFEIAKNYLTIQHMRYPGMFTAVYELSDALHTYPVPKLTLQPLVENALYHGIRPMGQQGMITVSAVPSGRSVILSIKDDGIGISEEKLDSMGEEQLIHNASSFGLRGTITRLRLFYGDSMSYSIGSSPGNGTLIEIEIPYLEDSEWKMEG
ncbi:cache domain-containing sensor histidine kinase [Paenibacillus sedimenti]|uniref:histidine kinase n=1 Tax=Paenibacillus sedimenti TaxID=2770274 RepID=A0A926KN69_9BACL|nr:sensor histidine kinase [Paenibacillus sedimenti]MBD0380929.1 histidine kinase [Paenibacillus sedimenti]